MVSKNWHAFFEKPRPHRWAPWRAPPSSRRLLNSEPPGGTLTSRCFLGYHTAPWQVYATLISKFC